MLEGLRNDEGRLAFWRLLPWTLFAVVGLGIAIGYLGVVPGVWGQTALYVLFLSAVLMLRNDLLSATILVGLGIVEDWYMLIPLPHGLFFSALAGAMALLLILFVRQRGERPWRHLRPHDLLFWGIFLLLGLLAVPRSINIPGNPKTIFFIAFNYWVHILLTAVMFWLLGAMIVRRDRDLRRLCVLLAALATVFAVHAIIQGLTGVIILETPYWTHYLAQPNVKGYRLPGGEVRATSFIMAPDTAEAFFSSMVFLPLGLLVASRTWTARALYALEVCAILLALLLTYGPVGWVAVVVGVVLFALFALHGRARQIFLGGLVAAVLALALVFTHELHTLLKHATGQNEINTRLGLFKTGMNVIRAHPLLGIGLGQGHPYQVRALPYKDPSQAHVYADAQNSFQEFAAFAGIPVLLAFVVVLGRGLFQSFRNIQRADATLRPVLVGAFLVVVGFCINGLSDVTFTTTPMVPMIYVLLGALSSPWLTRALASGNEETGATGATLPERPVVLVRYGPAQSPEAPPETRDRNGGNTTIR